MTDGQLARACPSSSGVTLPRSCPHGGRGPPPCTPQRESGGDRSPPLPAVLAGRASPSPGCPAPAEAVALQGFSNTHPEFCLRSNTVPTSHLSSLEKRPSVLSSGSRVGTTGHKGPAAGARPAASVSQRGAWLPLTAPVTQEPRSPANPAWLGNEPQESQVQISSLPRVVGAQRAQNETQTDAGPSAILGEEPQHHKGPLSP